MRKIQYVLFLQQDKLGLSVLTDYFSLVITSWIQLNQCSPLDNCEKNFLGTVKCFKFPKIQLLICNDILAPNLLLSVYC